MGQIGNEMQKSRYVEIVPILVFIPLVAESICLGWHTVAQGEVRKLGAALARHTGQEEGHRAPLLLSWPEFPGPFLMVCSE